MKGLRKIFGIPPTHIDRTWTDDKVLYKANKDVGVEFPLLDKRKINKSHTRKKRNAFRFSDTSLEQMITTR